MGGGVGGKDVFLQPSLAKNTMFLSYLREMGRKNTEYRSANEVVVPPGEQAIIPWGSSRGSDEHPADGP